MSKGTVVAAMSGGVDSAVAAALLKEQGYDVIGITLQIWQERSEQGKHGGCCSLGAVEDARRAAAKIGIPHYVLNFRQQFADTVISRFIEDYRQGRTPNPCIECNRSVKFDELLKQAQDLGADYLATGHYARIRFNETTGRHELLKAFDPDKDQSYALFTLTQQALSKTLMPLGYLESKRETRRIAAELGLALAAKPDSQEICFVPKEGYVSFLRDAAPSALRPGPIVNTEGKTIGEHEGVALYTIGQRKRMPASSSGPLFVLSLDAETNTVVAGSNEELFVNGFTAENLCWCALDGLKAGNNPLAAQVKIRYNGQSAETLLREERSGTVEGAFKTPQRAVTPGQSAVFYGGEGEEEGRVVLGGGTITGAFSEKPEWS